VPNFANVGVIDTLMSVPAEMTGSGYSFLDGMMQGAHKKDTKKGHPADYLFKEVPKSEKGEEGAQFVLGEMDKHGVDMGVIDATDPEGVGSRTIGKYPNRFVGTVQLDPNRGMDAVRLLETRVQSGEVIAASVFPAFVNPQVPINDKKMYPIYAKCSELGVPIFLTTGVPGPRVPMMAQHVELLDEVCWFFPDLKIIMRHGGDPWTELAAKLLLKWPNLFYSTSAFAPKHYPRTIIDFANKRGADKVIYAGYFPIGLTLDRIFSELPDVPFGEDVWPKFLRENAVRVLGLDKRFGLK